MSDAQILDELSELITDEASRIASSARRLKLRSDNVATWLQMVIDLAGPDREATSQIRKSMVTPLFRPSVKTAADLRFMRPRGQVRR
jgi:hypothetical protein